MDDALVRLVKPLVSEAARRKLRRIRSLDFLPHTPLGDYLWALQRFWRINKRFPRRNRQLISDFLFYVRIDELTMPERAVITDKEHVKFFVRDRVGDRYNVPVLAVLRSAHDADIFPYPGECVIKPTHMCGEIVFNRLGNSIDRPRIARWFARNYYEETREANYKTLLPKVIVEPFVFGSDLGPAPDYKITCIDGKPRVIRLIVPTANSSKRSFFDCDWRIQDVNSDYEPLPRDTPRPESLDEMLEVAARLSAGFSYLRVDLYTDGKQVRVGELTNCHAGGLFPRFTTPNGEELFSKLLWPDRR